MPYVQVAQGTASDVEQLGRFQGYFPEYSEGYVDIELRSQVAADIIGWLDEKLDVVGVPRNAVKVEGRFVRIYFRTEIAPLVLIASAIAACIFIAFIFTDFIRNIRLSIKSRIKRINFCNFHKRAI